MINAEKLELIKNTAQENILDVISDFIKLKKVGSQYIGKSPFTNERTPSFTVHKSKGIFKCFSSGNGGDAIRFLMITQNWKFTEAISYLSKKFKIDIDTQVDYQVKNNYIKKTPVLELIPSYIPLDHIKSTLCNYEQSNLFNFISEKTSHSKAIDSFNKYSIGIDHSESYTKDWVVFWQIDYNGNVRSGKYIKYLNNGRRDKESRTTWHHCKQKEYIPMYPDFRLVQSFFGENLIKGSSKPIGVVESEKTALIANIVFDKYTWIACGSKNGLNEVKCRVLKNRSVVLFPDLNAHSEWLSLAKRYNFSVSDVLSKFASDDDIKNGYDLADFLLR